VKSAGNFVRVAVEFSAGVQHSENDFGRRTLFRSVHIDRNAAAVIHHGDGIVDVHGDIYFVGVAGHGFVNGIVDDFPHQVMQTHFAGGADVHGGTQAHSFKAAENFDGFCVVLVAWRGSDDRFFIFHEYSA